MRQLKSKIRITILICILLLVLIITGIKVEHLNCKKCGMQAYIRYVWGIEITSMSEKEYNEFGTADFSCDNEWRVITVSRLWGSNSSKPDLSKDRIE